VDVADETLTSLLGRVGNVVNANVDDNRARLEPISVYELGFANRRDDDVCCFDLNEKFALVYVCIDRCPMTLTISCTFFVRLWHWVTVASLLRSMAATGLPTMSDRPSTTAWRPAMGTPVASMSLMTPAGVQGLNRGSEERDAR
jgi:hypothetical protein